jgi:RNA-directed DNA polymerase
MIKPTINLQELRVRIGSRAKSAPAHRFWGLYTHIKKPETLAAAYQEAKGNGGSPGIDGVSFAQLEADGRDALLAELAVALTEGTYRPQGYRKVEIPKGNGKTRTISIPTIRDRVVQGAVKLILEPIFEADFSDSSFGARPGRSAHEAMHRVRQGLRQRRHRVVDVDLSGFFDNITHSVLLCRLARRIQDPEVLAMLKRFLKGAGKRGIPQGSPLSPLLANVALNDLDHALDRGHEVISYVRYLDDMVVLAPDSRTGRLWADRALQRIEQEAGAIGVSLNQEKTRVVTITDVGSSFSFLGFDVRWMRSGKRGTWYPHTTPRRQKVTELRRRIRQVLRHSQHLPVREVVTQRVNPILRGWVNYFRVGNSRPAFDHLRVWAERRVRRFAAKQRQRPGFGFGRWSTEVLYQVWGLYDDYQIRYYALSKAAGASNRPITSA